MRNERGFISIIVLLAVLALCCVGCTQGLISPMVSIGQTVDYQSGSSDLEITSSGDTGLDVEVNLAELTEAGKGKINAVGAHSVVDKGTHANLRQTGTRSVEATFRGGYEKTGAGTDAEADHFSESSISAGGGALHDLIRGRGIDGNRANVPALPMREKRKEISPPAPVPQN